MKKEIIVRKNSAQRIGIFVVFLFMLSLSILMTILFYPLYYFGLLSMIGTLPALYAFLYYKTWQISFSSRSIKVRLMLRRTRSYSYAQIQDGYIANSYTLYQHISLLFYDKRRLRIRMEDENANQALKLIQLHYPLQNKNW